ncbi:MAG: ABC transporter ATP-binding protein [Planctomycetes bacterium]|nr:ABC transporter ATP-binding protein [Planctomycetota bacterium]
MTTEPAIRIRDLSKSFDRTKALDAVGFDVPVGSIFGLLGPNGAGKTTLFSIAAGFLRADSGSLRVLGVDIARVADLQGRMTILPQDASFQRNVPILEQLAFLRQLDGSDRATAEREVTEALELVGIAEYRKRGIHALSHGMLKRMGIAQAFLGQPEVILLDEPTSGLDPQNARQIRDLVRDLQRSRQVTTLISSHNLAEIQELCDHVAILDRGLVKAAGPVAEITRQGRMLEVELPRELTAAEQARLGEVPGVAAVEVRAPRRYRWSLAADGDEVVIAVLRALLDLGLAPRNVSAGNSLEEYFLAVTGDAPR